jgi:hypothetical protein
MELVCCILRTFSWSYGNIDTEIYQLEMVFHKWSNNETTDFYILQRLKVLEFYHNRQNSVVALVYDHLIFDISGKNF